MISSDRQPPLLDVLEREPYQKCSDITIFVFTSLLLDGVYKVKPGNREVQTICKFSQHGGAWTLMLTSATDNGWTRDNIRSRNTSNPSLSSDFSILDMADKITNMKHFQVTYSVGFFFFCNSNLKEKLSCQH